MVERTYSDPQTIPQRTVSTGGGGEGGPVAWVDVTSKPTEFAPTTHTHIITDVTGLQAALDAKQVSGTYATGTGSANGANTGDQFTNMTSSRILGRATAGFGPAEQLTGAQVQAMLDLSTYATVGSLSSYVTTANFTWTNLGGKPTTFAPSAHTHVIADVTGLQSTLDGKQAAGTYASGTGSASGTNTGDETKATIDTKIGATGGTTFYRKDGTWAAPAGGTGGTDPWAWSKLAADSAANSTVTLATAGLSFEAAANSTYIVRIVGGFISAAATTGIALALDVPTGCIVAGTGYHMTTAAGASAGFEQIADNATIGATTGVRAINTLVPIEASWIIETGATAGTVTLMFRSEVAASAVTLKKPFGFGARLI